MSFFYLDISLNEMQNTLSNIGKISSIEASKLFGITNDYVTLLCRQKKVDGQLIGRLWFVDQQSLGNYLTNIRASQAKQKKEMMLKKHFGILLKVLKKQLKTFKI